MSREEREIVCVSMRVGYTRVRVCPLRFGFNAILDEMELHQGWSELLDDPEGRGILYDSPITDRSKLSSCPAGNPRHRA